MGNGTSQHLYNIGKCCSNEEIDEVIRKDNGQTLDFDDKSPRATPLPPSQHLGKQEKKTTITELQAVIKL